MHARRGQLARDSQDDSDFHESKARKENKLQREQIWQLKKKKKMLKPFISSYILKKTSLKCAENLCVLYRNTLLSQYIL